MNEFYKTKRAGILGFALILSAFLLNASTAVFAQKTSRSKRAVSTKTKKKGQKTIRQKEFVATPRSEDEFEADPEKRREWFMQQRTYPFDEVPVEARRKAWESVDKDNLRNANLPVWQSVGPITTNSYFPNNWGITSGRINAIAVSPNDSNLILVGAATGGVWRSTDGGGVFYPVTDNHVDLAIGSIAFAPSNPSIVYAGMGDKASGYNGTGVLKSTDGGQTWVKINNATLPAPGRISKIDVDRNNPNRVYVAQYSYLSNGSNFSSGFYYSTDGGVSWTRTQAGLPRDFVFHPTQPNVIYLANARADGQTPTTGGIFKSTDNGATWTRIYTTTFASVSNIKVAVTPIAPSNVYLLVGSGSAAQVEISSDEGATWVNKGSAFDTGQFSFNCYLFVNPANADTIYVGTRDLWRSTDGGTTYTNITGNFSITGGYNPFSAKSHPDQHHMYISPSNPNIMMIANDGGLWRTVDNAASFQSLNQTLGLTMFTSLDLHPTNPQISYGGTQDNGTQKRLSNASAWREFATGDGGQTFVDPLDNTIVYTTYVYGSVQRYTNNGDGTRTTIGTDAIFNNDRVAFYPPFVGNETDSTLYFGTYRLYVSTNRGTAWTAPGGATDLTNGGGDILSSIGVAKSDKNYIYTGSAQGRAMRSTDGGVTWTNITAGLPNRFIKDIEVDRTSPQIVYLTVSGYLTPHVYKTVDGGTTWTNISSNLPDVPVNTIYPMAGNLYIGTDIGVFRSSNEGASWELFNTGMPPVIVTEIDGQGSNLLQAATYGRSAYEIKLDNRKSKFDYDGDGRADISVFRPSSGTWYLNRSASGLTSVQFGSNGDAPAPADFDGDGKSDLAVFRPSSGTWFILQSATAAVRAVQYGTAGDLPRPADYDGDGRADLMVYRPATGVWYGLRSSDGAPFGYVWGTAGDVAVAEDFDGDGRADVGVYRPATGVWYVLPSASPASPLIVQFGLAEDKVVAADYDGDGRADIAVYRPSSGIWYLRRSSDAQVVGVQFGLAEDKVVAADYDGDGRADIAVYRPATGVWYVRLAASGAVSGQQYGVAEDIPSPNSFSN